MFRQFCFVLIIPIYVYLPCKAQSALDTVEIFKNKCGIDFNTYKKKWFGGSYRYTLNRLNHQDSIIFIHDTARYIKVHDANDKLWFEGETDYTGSMVGEVKWYDKAGRLDHSVVYGQSVRLIGGGDSMCILFESPTACEWRSYYSNGVVKKETVYLIGADRCYAPDSKYYRRTIRYKQNGEIRSRRTRRASTWNMMIITEY